MAITIPNTFADGETIDAARQNANFSAIATAALDKTGDTTSGTITLGAGIAAADQVITRPELKDYSETATAPSIAAGALTLNCENGSTFTVSLNADITSLTISNPPATGKLGAILIVFTADGTVRAITWGASVKFAGGAGPTMTGTSGNKDIISMVTTDAGTNWYAVVVGQNF